MVEHGSARNLEAAPEPELPDFVVVGDDPDIRLRPNEMRVLKAQTGRTLQELLGPEGDEEDRLQLLIWLELRRQGFEPSWEEAGDVAVTVEQKPADPTNGEPSETSPPSASGMDSAPDRSTK